MLRRTDVVLVEAWDVVAVTALLEGLSLTTISIGEGYTNLLATSPASAGEASSAR